MEMQIQQPHLHYKGSSLSPSTMQMIRNPHMSCSASSSSYSPSSSAVASWYCWYSDTRSFMLLSASVNSISSMPSPSVPVQESLAPEHHSKLLTHPPEQSRVSSEYKKAREIYNLLFEQASVRFSCTYI
jgi:hypothetical protein